MRLVGRFRRRGAVPEPRLPARASLIGTRGSNLAGERPDGTAIELAVTDGTAALLFLTGSCYGCQVLWEGARASSGPPDPAPPGPLPPGPLLPASPLVIITPSPTTEDARVVATLAPEAEIPVIMSSAVWHSYRVARAPWYVGVADGIVVADGLAPGTWSELAAEVARLRGPGGSGGSGASGGPGPPDALGTSGEAAG